MTYKDLLNPEYESDEFFKESDEFFEKLTSLLGEENISGIELNVCFYGSCFQVGGWRFGYNESKYPDYEPTYNVWVSHNIGPLRGEYKIEYDMLKGTREFDIHVTPEELAAKVKKYYAVGKAAIDARKNKEAV